MSNNSRIADARALADSELRSALAGLDIDDFDAQLPLFQSFIYRVKQLFFQEAEALLQGSADCAAFERSLPVLRQRIIDEYAQEHPPKLTDSEREERTGDWPIDQPQHVRAADKWDIFCPTLLLPNKKLAVRRELGLALEEQTSYWTTESQRRFCAQLFSPSDSRIGDRGEGHIVHPDPAEIRTADAQDTNARDDGPIPLPSDDERGKRLGTASQCLTSLPAFAAADVEMRNRTEPILCDMQKQSLPRTQALAWLDATAGSYLPLITDQRSWDAYRILLYDLWYRKAYEMLFGSVFMQPLLQDGIDLADQLDARRRHWHQKASEALAACNDADCIETQIELSASDSQSNKSIQIKAPRFRYQYGDDFPESEQLAIENARLEANRRLESSPIESYNGHRAARVEWFRQLVSAAAVAIGRAGAARGWGANRRREELFNFGSKAADAAGIAGPQGHGFREIAESEVWVALEDRLHQAINDLARQESIQGTAAVANGFTRKFRKDGKVWEIAYGDRRKSVPHSMGMDHIAYLLARPHVPIEALALASPSTDGEMKQVISGGLEKADEKAIRHVEVELKEKEAALAALVEKDGFRRGALREEIEKLEKYLLSVRSYAGAVRKTGGTVERARTSVTNAIRRAVDNIREVHPELATHLESIRMGNSLVYSPDEEDPGWET